MENSQESTLLDQIRELLSGKDARSGASVDGAGSASSKTGDNATDTGKVQSAETGSVNDVAAEVPAGQVAIEAGSDLYRFVHGDEPRKSLPKVQLIAEEDRQRVSTYAAVARSVGKRSVL